MNFTKKIYSIVFISLFTVSLFGQEKNNNVTTLGTAFNKGFIWAHTSKLEGIADGNPWGFQLDWSRISISKKAWERCNCYSKTGLSFVYYNYQNREVLGNSYNLIAFAEPYLNFNKKLYYTVRAGIGATYLNKVYDPVTNPQNLFYSSHLSFIVLANFSVNYKLAPEWSIKFSGNYNHISNGGMKKPNKGMNFPTFGIGVDYYLDQVALPDQEKVIKEKGNLRFYTRFFTTRPDIPPTDQLPPGRAWLFGIAAGGLVNIANFQGINIGLEIIQDNSLKEEGIRRNINKDHHIIAPVIGHHLFFGKFDFNQQLGYYLYKPFPFTDHKFYQRWELAYHLTSELIIGASLKTHLEVAENFDVRIGYIFK